MEHYPRRSITQHTKTFRQGLSGNMSQNSQLSMKIPINICRNNRTVSYGHVLTQVNAPTCKEIHALRRSFCGRMCKGLCTMICRAFVYEVRTHTLHSSPTQFTICSETDTLRLRSSLRYRPPAARGCRLAPPTPPCSAERATFQPEVLSLPEVSISASGRWRLPQARERPAGAAAGAAWAAGSAEKYAGLGAAGQGP